jgi:hypothetical protein
VPGFDQPESETFEEMISRLKRRFPDPKDAPAPSAIRLAQDARKANGGTPTPPASPERMAEAREASQRLLNQAERLSKRMDLAQAYAEAADAACGQALERWKALSQTERDALIEAGVEPIVSVVPEWSK